MLTIVPYTIAQANAYVAQHHRHHQTVTASRFALAVADEFGQVGSPEPIAHHTNITRQRCAE